MDGAGDLTSAHFNVMGACRSSDRHSDECSVGMLQETAAVKAADLSDHERQAKLLDLCRKVIDPPTVPDDVCRVECKLRCFRHVKRDPCRR